ncbi:Glycosyltransferase involved in cell wall bisynthesis [Reichenbachiella faecimaris]|uniref:Glycosyltransferase involved in cell wall bisynthesis n=1 Tax=Reichenbachiella faecimaris TaxID=692418 RepID=A0A1W2GDN7_REIFA|nr:glycosyltransferase [Reichenbachiella faecimaris]SMD34376.1 Glycosyltransferase involved in cell wall bisynthesis [Reichenbachiella faecimaris]
MKVAIIHDDLMRRGGAEKVAKTISNLYPDAPIYTLAYRPESTYPEFKDKNIITSWFQWFARNEFLMKWLFFPLGLLAMRSIKLKGYDLVIMSTTYCAKYVKIQPGTRIVAYCYTPFRLAWNPMSYDIYKNSKGSIRWVFDNVVTILKNVDKKASTQIDYFIAMTQETRERLIAAYHPKNNIPIINPAVELSNFSISSKIEDYYLLVSRFEPYKKVDLAIEAFNKNGRHLIIVGRGSQKEKLIGLAGKNIEFRENLSDLELAKLYENCRGFIFPQYEDYGITPLEANAAGRPVIAYNKGGVLDTMIPYHLDRKNATAYFFDEQSVESLNRAINAFEKVNFAPNKMRANAERFSEKRFKSELKNFIDSIE